MCNPTSRVESDLSSVPFEYPSRPLPRALFSRTRSAVGEYPVNIEPSDLAQPRASTRLAPISVVNSFCRRRRLSVVNGLSPGRAGRSGATLLRKTHQTGQLLQRPCAQVRARGSRLGSVRFGRSGLTREVGLHMCTPQKNSAREPP